MGLVLVPEIADGGKDGVGGRLAQAAEGAVLDAYAQLLQQLDVPFLALASQIRSRISFIRVVPMRQGTHLPQDSRAVKSRKNRAMFTMQVLSSMTTMPPEP